MMNNEKIFKTALIFIIGSALGLLDAVFSIYTKKIIPMSEWNLHSGSISSLTEVFKSYQLLQIGQASEITILIIIIACAFASGFDAKTRAGFLLLLLGLWKSLRVLFLFFIIGYPKDFAAWDLVFLYPSLTFSPVYLTFGISLIFLILAFILLTKQGGEASNNSKPARKKKKKS